MFNIAPYRKAIVAAIGGLTVIAAAVTEAVQDGYIDFVEIATIVTAVAVAFGVYEVPNAPVANDEVEGD